MLLAVLVLCFGKTALAEETPVQPEIPPQTQTESQEQSDGGVDDETQTIPPLAADGTSPETEGSTPTDNIPLFEEEEPESETPESTDPEPEQPESTDPEPEQPESTDPEPEQPESTDPEPEQPESTDPEPEQPESTDPEPEQPEPEEPEPDLPSGEIPTPAPVHEAGHHVEERVHPGAVYQATDNRQAHIAVITYDLYCAECQRIVLENCRVEQREELHAWTYAREEPTCSREGSVHFLCSLCGLAYDEALPALEHVWGEWEDHSDFSLPECQREEIKAHTCVICGKEETVTLPPRGHQWAAVSYIEATCVQDGEAVRRCVLCGAEETIVLPALGHTYVKDDSSSAGQAVCAICGAKKESDQEKNQQSHIHYNNTVTSFGPTTRELIGGSVWNRVTPVDLSKEGVFTFPLVAGNQYTVGTVTVVNGEDGQQVNYKLNSPQINVHSESLVVYPNLEALKTGANAKSFGFNEHIDLKSCFGSDARVIIAITLKADYDADSAGVRNFSPDQNLIDQMREMIK